LTVPSGSPAAAIQKKPNLLLFPLSTIQLHLFPIKSFNPRTDSIPGDAGLPQQADFFLRKIPGKIVKTVGPGALGKGVPLPVQKFAGTSVQESGGGYPGCG